MSAAYEDLYAVLGVSSTASKDELKRAYRKLARKYHPDVNKAPDAESKMQTVTAAYETLADDAKRREYDEQRKWGATGAPTVSNAGGSRWTGTASDGYTGYSSPFSSFYTGAGRFDSFNPNVDYGEFVYHNPFSSFSRGGSGFDGMMDGPDGDAPGTLRAELTIDFKTAVEGAEEISLSVGSDGRIVSAKLPAGLRDGQTIRLRGRGARIRGAGRKRGDLLIKVTVQPDPSGVWSMGADGVLSRKLPLTISEAVLGGPVEVAGWGGKKIRLKVPAGVIDGARLKVPNLGPTGVTAACIVSTLQPDGSSAQVKRAMRDLQAADSKTASEAANGRMNG